MIALKNLAASLQTSACMQLTSTVQLKPDKLNSLRTLASMPAKKKNMKITSRDTIETRYFLFFIAGTCS